MMSLIRKYHRLKPLTKLLLLVLISITALIYYIFIHDRSNEFKTMANSGEGTTYSHLIDTFEVNSFAKLPMSTKCGSYFHELYKFNPDWQIDNLQDLQYVIPLAKDRKRYEREMYKLRRANSKLRTMSKQQRLKLILDITKEVDAMAMMNLEIERQIADSVGHLKIFGKCFIENNLDISLYTSLEAKLFPWLSFRLPVYQRWDGVVVTDRLPVVDNYITKTPTAKNERYDPLEDSFILYLQKSMKGKGVVMSISNSQVENTIRFIKVLRFLQNEIPIQLVHKGDLSKTSQQRLISLARDDLYVLNKEVHIDNYKQELWFVDVSRCIRGENLHNFEMYANKWLAVLFNSFDEIILVDDDSIPFVQPELFFQMPKYIETGTLFFKDREIDGKMEENFHKLYESLLPTINDEKLFDIKRIPLRLYNSLRFFTKEVRHQMESGLVVLKRSTHMSGLLISTHLQIWGPTSTPVHGDKELFWLGQIISGTTILFNDHPLGAVGYLDDFKPQNKLCSIQPSHIHDDAHTLLWVNSGLRNCKYDTWDNDIKLRYYNNYTVDSLRDHYKQPLLINSVIIPPDMLLEFPNKDHKPFKGWAKLNGMGCQDYFFCAYDKIGSDRVKDWKSFGKLIRYNDHEQIHLNNVARVWTGL